MISHNAYFNDYFGQAKPAAPLTAMQQYVIDCRRMKEICAERNCSNFEARQIMLSERAGAK